MSNNPSFVLQGIEDVVYEERPIPTIDDYDVLIEVKKTGICGTDVHYLVDGRVGDFVVNKPIVLGHEASGVVCKVGAKVSHLKTGDRVALEPGVTCRLCEKCKTGRYELCPNIMFAANPPYDGTLARYYRLPGDIVYKLPDSLSLEDGALIEPLAVAVHAVATVAAFRTNQTIAIWGAGTIGLLTMAVAKALGAARIIAVDIVPSRLEVAKNYAATDTFVPPALEPGETKMAYSRRSASLMSQKLGISEDGPNSVDVVVDASGAEVAIQAALYVVKSGGNCIQVGMGTAEVQIPVTLLLTRELNLKGSFRFGPGDYPLAIALVAQGKIDLKPLVTHRFAFTDAINAFKTARAGKSEDGRDLIKAIISGPDVSVDDH